MDDQPAPLDSGKSDPASQPETTVSVSPAKKMVVMAQELKVIRIFCLFHLPVGIGKKSRPHFKHYTLYTNINF